MHAYAFDVKESLLESGKAEFLKNGFEKASLRSICKNAGVTTGAFYSYFENKEDLFSKIVEPVIGTFYDRKKVNSHLKKQEHYTNGDSELRNIEFMMEHKDVFILLFDRSDGTKYEGFQEAILKGFMLESYQNHMDFHVGKPVDSNLVNIILRMKFEEYKQFLYGNYSMEEIRKLVKYTTSFSEAGFIQLMKDIQSEDQ